MRRRDLLLAIPGMALAQTGKPREYVTAAASRDTAPRVGLIASTYTGGEEMDGKKLRPLKTPVAVNAALNAAQLDDMLRLAVELGGGRRGGLVTAVAPDEWVVIDVSIGKAAGASTDPRLVRSALALLADAKRGRRFTLAAGGEGVAGETMWTSAWDGEFDGLTYRAIAAEFARAHPTLKLELLDLNQDAVLEMPVDGHIAAARNPSGAYTIARTLRHCDKVITIGPLRTHPATGVALSTMSYLGFASAQRYGADKSDLWKLGDPGEIALDLCSFHPADYAILGGGVALEGDGAARRHNVIVAGNRSLAVDAVGAAVMGFTPSAVRHLKLSVDRGYGTEDAESIWTRGNEIPDARAEFRKPAGWKG
jgi:hypothetical protein